MPPVSLPIAFTLKTDFENTPGWRTRPYGEDIGQDARIMLDNACEAVLSLGDHSAGKRGTDFATAAASTPARA